MVAAIVFSAPKTRVRRGRRSPAHSAIATLLSTLRIDPSSLASSKTYSLFTTCAEQRPRIHPLVSKGSNFNRALLSSGLWTSRNSAVAARSLSRDTSLPSMAPNTNNDLDMTSLTIPVLPTVASPFEPPPESPHRKPLGLWPGMYHSPVTDALWKARFSICERLWPPPSADGPPQQTLLTRTPEDSRVSIIYNFTSDYILREQYRNAWNECRIGKLMEDLDALAGTIAVKHCSDNDSTTRPLLLVTASVDKIHLRKPVTLEEDVKMSGAVVWVGRSSIEIRMEIRQPAKGLAEDQNSIALIANFRFVARDSKTGKAAPVNQLAPQTEEEKKLFTEGQLRDARQKKWRIQRQQDVSGGLKSVQDLERLRALLAEGRVLTDMPALADRNSMLIKDTVLENVHICQPQQRNMHGRIFGGFLMRMAFELAFSTCYLFVGWRPLFVEVDRIDFLRPVDVGDFLRFKSCVLYTETDDPKRPLISIEVVAHVTRPELRTSEISNTFYFTFSHCSEGDLENFPSVRKVLPATEEEARLVLQRYDIDHEEGDQSG